MEMETTDEGILGLANVLAVETTGAKVAGADGVPLGSINLDERTKLLERAFSMRNKLDLLINHLTSSKTGGSFSRSPVGIDSRKMEIDVPLSDTLRRMGTVARERQSECCEHFCSYMNPALWSKLPTELLQMVFARLPFPQVYQDVRLLSKEWKWSATTGDSELNRARAEANSKIFAMVFDYEWEIDESRFTENYVYDTKENLWRFFPMQKYGRVNCASGGLLCCVPSSKAVAKILISTRDGITKKLMTEEKESSLPISVYNPLTRQRKELPSHSLSLMQPRMVQLVVNRDTKCYEVVVVGDRNGGVGDIMATVYNSGTGAWSSASTMSNCIFGHELHCDDELEALFLPTDRRLRFCAFDYARDEFIQLDGPGPDIGASVHGSALVGDHLFVLHREPYGSYYILEYQGRTCKPNWVKLRSHKCHDFRYDLDEIYTLRLDACEGCLMVTATNNHRRHDHVLSEAYGHELAWFYDVATGEWNRVAAPKNLVGDPEGIMCELRWDAVP